MRKTTKILFAILASAALVALSGCSGCKTKPEITGAADDGLYLYSGNMRYTSDYENGEELITSVDIDGVTQNFIEVTGVHYVGDDAYMAVTYYENNTYIPRAGSCIVKYNVANKTQEIIYNYAYDGSFGGRYIVDDILWASGDGLKIAALSDYGYTLIIYGGKVVDEIRDETEYTVDDEFYAYADAGYKNIVCKSWDGEIVNEFKSIHPIDGLEIYGGKLYARTFCSYRGEQWRNEDWEYVCNGIESYDPFSGERLSMFDPSTYKTIYDDLQAGFSIIGQMSAHIIDGETRVYATDFELYLYEDDAFYYFCDFEDSTADWTYDMPEVRGDHIIFGGCGGEDGEYVTDKKCYFNLKTHAFEADPELPVEVSAEYGDYYFYIDYPDPIIITANEYIVLHRVNKVTGADDVMAYAMVDYEDYNIDIVRDY